MGIAWCIVYGNAVVVLDVVCLILMRILNSWSVVPRSTIVQVCVTHSGKTVWVTSFMQLLGGVYLSSSANAIVCLVRKLSRFGNCVCGCNAFAFCVQ